MRIPHKHYNSIANGRITLLMSMDNGYHGDPPREALKAHADNETCCTEEDCSVSSLRLPRPWPQEPHYNIIYHGYRKPTEAELDTLMVGTIGGDGMATLRQYLEKEPAKAGPYTPTRR